jgi:hypothetical protein
MLVISLTKRFLSSHSTSTSERLNILEKMNSLTDQFLTAEMVSAIKPMSDVEYEMLSAALSLDGGDAKRAATSADILTRSDVFGLFVRLNPSLLAAIKFREQAIKRHDNA